MDFYVFNYQLTHEFLQSLEHTHTEFQIHGVSGNNSIKPDMTDKEFFIAFQKNKIIKEIAETMTSQSIGQFSFFSKVPELVNKITFNILEYQTEHDEERYSVQVPLAPILGLPGIKGDKEELNELKDLFLFLKQEQLNKPLQDFKLSVHRGFGETEMTISCKNKVIEEEINTTFQNKINTSPVLTAWQNNILKGIENTSTQCDNLFYNTSFSFLFDFKEMNDLYLKKDEAKKKENEDKKNEKYKSLVEEIKTKKKTFF